jgi:acyl-CoA synthetase (AMP-forming)/AMP-acid ligase II
MVSRAGSTFVTPDEWLLVAVEKATGAGDEPVITDVPAVIIDTTRTTSAPKGVLLRHENLVSYVLGTVEFAAADAEDAALMSAPRTHRRRLQCADQPVRRAPVLVPETFNERTWLDVVRTERVTNAMVVPTMLARIMDAEGIDRSVPTLRSLALRRREDADTGHREGPAGMAGRRFRQRLRLTETSSTVTVLDPDEHRAAVASDDPDVRARLSSAG